MLVFFKNLLIKMLSHLIVGNLENNRDDFRNCKNYHSRVLFEQSEIVRPLGCEAMITSDTTGFTPYACV